MANPPLASPREAWPPEPLQAFVLRMAGHGHSISSTMMTHDSRYALEQLSYAHTMADDRLRELAMALFRNFERRRSGVLIEARRGFKPRRVLRGPWP